LGYTVANAAFVNAMGKWSSMARIAVFQNLPSGGAKRALFEWAQRLSNRHTIDVYSLSGANHDYCDLRPYASAYHVTRFQELGLFRSPLGRLNQWQRYRDLQRLNDLYQDMAAKINAGGYDVVFLNPCIYTFIPLLQLHLQLPSLYYLHEHFGNRVERAFSRNYLTGNKVREWLDRYDPLIPLYRNQLRNLQWLAVQRVNRFLSNSEFTRLQFKTDFDTDAPVVHLGVNSNIFRPDEKIERGSHVLSVGEITPRKGFDFLIESLALLPPNQRPVLRLACNRQIPEERHYIEHLAVQRGVQLEILFNLDSTQLAKEYSWAGAVVYSPVTEPFGLVPLEAMACAAPVVGVAEGGVLESVVDGVTGRLTPRDPHAFAAAVAEVLGNPAQAKRFGLNGREHIVNHWSWDRSATLLENHLLEVAAKK
jgi:glycosyltransferase involved in cell wall biosynthesis